MKIHSRTTDLTFRNANGDIALSIAANDTGIEVLIGGDDPVRHTWEDEDAGQLISAMELFCREAGSLKTMRWLDRTSNRGAKTNG